MNNVYARDEKYDNDEEASYQSMLMLMLMHNVFMYYSVTNYAHIEKAAEGQEYIIYTL